MRYTPETKRIYAIMVCSALFVSSAVFFGFSYIENGLSSSILKTLAAISFMAAVVLVSRYLVFVYRYCADENEFLVIQSTNNYSKTVCRLYYTDIIKIEKTKEFAKNSKIKYNEKHNYCLNLFSKESYTMVYKLENEYGLIVFEPDESFVGYIEKYITNDIFLP